SGAACQANPLKARRGKLESLYLASSPMSLWLRTVRCRLLILVCLGLPGAAGKLMAATNLPPLDLTVTRLLGTSRPEEIMLNRIVPWGGAHLGGVHIDTGRVPNRFYVLDSANNRILGFYGFKRGVFNAEFLPADIVIGQPSMWDHGTANG